MQYAFQIKPHANVRYFQSMEKLAQAECQCLLHGLQIEAIVTQEKLAGTSFLIIETEQLDEKSWDYLSCNAGVSFAAVKQGEWLKPLPLNQAKYMEADLARVLKYKGKTNADFTLMMIHCAKAASAYSMKDAPCTVLDPLCGRATALFCALQEGDHAIGIEINAKAMHEADVYFKRYLQYHRLKHERQKMSVTLREGGHANEIRYRFSNSAQAYKNRDVRTLRLLQGDTIRTDEIAGKEICEVLVADLPYGVQHSAKSGQKHTSLLQLMRAAFPAYQKALKDGGAAAIAFNTFTLKREMVEEELGKAGLSVMTQPPFNDFAHWVEQAVNRDMVIAVKK